MANLCPKTDIRMGPCREELFAWRGKKLVQFGEGESSLRFDKAEMLADYLGIECRPARKKGKNS